MKNKIGILASLLLSVVFACKKDGRGSLIGYKKAALALTQKNATARGPFVYYAAITSTGASYGASSSWSKVDLSNNSQTQSIISIPKGDTITVQNKKYVASSLGFFNVNASCIDGCNFYSVGQAGSGIGGFKVGRAYYSVNGQSYFLKLPVNFYSSLQGAERDAYNAYSVYRNGGHTYVAGTVTLTSLPRGYIFGYGKPVRFPLSKPIYWIDGVPTIVGLTVAGKDGRGKPAQVVNNVNETGHQMYVDVNANPLTGKNDVYIVGDSVVGNYRVATYWKNGAIVDMNANFKNNVYYPTNGQGISSAATFTSALKITDPPVVSSQSHFKIQVAVSGPDGWQDAVVDPVSSSYTPEFNNLNEPLNNNVFADGVTDQYLTPFTFDQYINPQSNTAQIASILYNSITLPVGSGVYAPHVAIVSCSFTDGTWRYGIVPYYYPNLNPFPYLSVYSIPLNVYRVNNRALLNGEVAGLAYGN